MEMDIEWMYELGCCQFYRGRPVHIWPTGSVYSTTGELRRRIHGMNENGQLPSEKIRLFSDGKELLVDEEELPRNLFIYVVYGDDQAVHIRNQGRIYKTVGVLSSDQVVTIREKIPIVFFEKARLVLNGTLLDNNRTISSYNIKDGAVLEMEEETNETVEETNETVEETTETVEETNETVEETTETVEETNETVEETNEPVEETNETEEEDTETEEEDTEEVQSAFMNKLKEAFGRFGEVCGSLKNVVSSGTYRTLADCLGTAKLDDMLTFITKIVKEVKFELPTVLQRASNNVLSDQDFIGIANSIGESWQSLGYSLGLNQVQIEQI